MKNAVNYGVKKRDTKVLENYNFNSYRIIRGKGSLHWRWYGRDGWRIAISHSHAQVAEGRVLHREQRAEYCADRRGQSITQGGEGKTLHREERAGYCTGN